MSFPLKIQQSFYLSAVWYSLPARLSVEGTLQGLIPALTSWGTSFGSGITLYSIQTGCHYGDRSWFLQQFSPQANQV